MLAKRLLHSFRGLPHSAALTRLAWFVGTRRRLFSLASFIYLAWIIHSKGPNFVFVSQIAESTLTSPSWAPCKFLETATLPTGSFRGRWSREWAVPWILSAPAHVSLSQWSTRRKAQPRKFWRNAHYLWLERSVWIVSLLSWYVRSHISHREFSKRTLMSFCLNTNLKQDS